MAEIEIVYREGYCEYKQSDYCTQCHTQCAEDLGCRCFNEEEERPNVIPFGDCKHAKFKYAYKGASVKNYEIEEFEDAYNPHLNCMLVTLGKTMYECEKVILNKEVLYNNCIT